MGVNKIILIGNLGTDPEVRHTQSGQAVCNFRMAVTEKYKSGGQEQERTDWFSVSVWGNQGEACGKHLAKGRQVYVEGRINERSYTDRDGNERKSMDVTAFNVTFLGGGQGQGGGQGGGGGGQSSGYGGGGGQSQGRSGGGQGGGGYGGGCGQSGGGAQGGGGGGQSGGGGWGGGQSGGGGGQGGGQGGGGGWGGGQNGGGQNGGGGGGAQGGASGKPEDDEPIPF